MRSIWLRTSSDSISHPNDFFFGGIASSLLVYVCGTAFRSCKGRCSFFAMAPQAILAGTMSRPRIARNDYCTVTYIPLAVLILNDR